jgi:hypothetical protein
MNYATERLILENQATIMSALYVRAKRRSAEQEALGKQISLIRAALRFDDVEAFLEKGISDPAELLRIRLSP